MTHLRQAMLEELHRRNYAASMIAYYIHNVEQFARFFKRAPGRPARNAEILTVLLS